jgi:hypothetical protein
MNTRVGLGRKECSSKDDTMDVDGGGHEKEWSCVVVSRVHTRRVGEG